MTEETSSIPPGARAARGGSPPAWAESLVLIVLVAVFLWRGFIPGWRSLNTDFPNYYLAAQLFRQGYALDRLYDWTWIQRQKDHAGIEKRIVGYVPLTYLSAMPVLPLSSLPPLAAKRCWMLASLLFLGVTIFLVGRMTSLGMRRIGILAFLVLDPLSTNFLYGQQHVLLLVLLTLAARWYLNGRHATSGATLALAAGLKIYPALFALYFLRKRQWRALVGLAFGGLAVVSLNFWLFGLQANRTYLLEVLPWPLRGEVNDPYNLHFNSLTALLHRLLISEPELNPHPLVQLPALYAVLQPLCQALLFVPVFWLLRPGKGEPAREKFEWGCYLFLLTVLSTNPASYHHSVMVLSGCLVAEFLLGTASRRQLAVFVFLYTLAGMPVYRWLDRFSSGWETFLAFPRLYAMLGLWAFIVWQMARAPRVPQPVGSRRREAYVFAAIFFALAITGSALSFRHLRGLYQNYASRLLTVPGSLFASEPVVAGGAVLFTAMRSPVYTTASLSGGKLEYAEFDSDALHPTISAESREVFIEIAGPESRIVRFPIDRIGFPGGKAAVVAENAEEPTVSADGRWLLFIRREHGRGSLWAKSLRPEAGSSGFPGGEWQWLSSEYDVADATMFRDGTTVVAARPHGRWDLFSGRVPQRGFVGEEAVGGPARYPAASPDGKWLAFCREERGNWQLWVMAMDSSGVALRGTAVRRQLTDAECNSTHPAWLPDSKTVVYATDCGRGLGLTALAQIRAIP